MLILKSLRSHARQLNGVAKISTKFNDNLQNRQQNLTLQIVRTNATYGVMSAWQVKDSLDNQQQVDIFDKLQCYKRVRIPTICSPWDVLVKVHSTSVNPLDVKMCYGYGRQVLDVLYMLSSFESRITYDRYPLTLGRDFSGEVIASGPAVRETYKPGDMVLGAIDPQRQGSHAHYVSVPSYNLTHKPSNLTHHEAASFPFVSLTAYAALSTFGGLDKNKCSNKNVLVLGGSGGVGSFAVQLLKLWGAHVSATCSENKTAWLEDTLLVDQSICYEDLSQLNELKGKFDFVLDCGRYEEMSITHTEVVTKGLEYLKPKSKSVYVNLSPPFLRNTDQQGVLVGAVSSMIQAVTDTANGVRNLNSARWAVFVPNKSALNYITQLHSDGSIVPQIDSVFAFSEAPKAYDALQNGAVCGKVIVDVSTTERLMQPNRRDRVNGATAKMVTSTDSCVTTDS